MENIFYYLQQPNEIFVQLLQLLSILLKVDISCKILITFFNYKSHIKNRIFYFILVFIFDGLIFFKMPLVYSTFLSLLFSTLILKLIFRIDIIPALISTISPVPIVITIKSIMIKILSPELGYTDTIAIPINYLIIFVVSYSTLYIIYYLLKKLKINLNGLVPLSKNQKFLFIFNLLLYLEVIYVQIYLMEFYEDCIPFYLILVNFVGMNAYFLINIYFGLMKNSLITYKEDLETEQLYNKSLQTLYDNLRYFKHDFNNIVQALGGFIQLKDYKGLEKYYDKLLQESRNTTNLSFLSPDIINNPAIQSLLTAKYFKATDLGITFDLEILLDLNNIDISIYDLSRILGILLDNAIEAANSCPNDNKHIIIQMNNNKKNNRKQIIIKNTYTNKNVNIDQIYKKGYTSKNADLKNHGLGLPKVRSIISSYSNLNLYTTKDKDYFIQQLEIYNVNKK